MVSFAQWKKKYYRGDWLDCNCMNFTVKFSLYDFFDLVVKDVALKLILTAKYFLHPKKDRALENKNFKAIFLSFLL